MNNHIFILVYFLQICICSKTNVVLNIRSILFNWFSIYVSKQKCQNNIICEIVENTFNNATGNMYSNMFDYYKKHEHSSLNIDVNGEPHQRWPRTHSISLGKDKDFQFSLTYPLYFNKYNFAMTYFNAHNNISNIIQSARESLKKFPFSKRKMSAVAIYGKRYRNRKSFVDLISKVINVDRFGAAFNKHYPKDKIELLRNYKFCIAAENSIHSAPWGQMTSNEIDDYYVTEKLIDCFKAGSIPIYFGPRNAKELYFPNKKSVIFSGDYKNYDEMMKYIASIKDYDKILNEYVSWPYSYSNEWYNRFNVDYSFNICRLCEFVNYYYIEKNHDNDEIKFDANDRIVKIKKRKI